MDNFIITIMAQTIMTGIVFALYNRFSKKRRIYCNDEGWQPISTCPDNIEELLLTDGEIVIASAIREYDKSGSIVIGYPKTKATHWRKFPCPPMK